MGVLIDKLLTVNDCADSQQRMFRKAKRERVRDRKEKRLLKSRLTCL